jgi:hypothetical protein
MHGHFDLKKSHFNSRNQVPDEPSVHCGSTELFNIEK